MRSLKHWFELGRYVPLLAATAGLITGCATNQFVSESIPQRMRAQPDAYRRIGILSFSLTSRAITDGSLTTNDLRVLSRRLGSNFVSALTEAFEDKGYQLARACEPLCTAEDWEELDRETGGLATEARRNLTTLSEEIYANHPNVKFNPIDYRIPASVAALGKKLGQDADVLVLVDSRVYIETPEAQRKRDKWNWTGGAILTPLVVGIGLFAVGGGGGPELPLKYSPAWVAHTILIADARSLEVLFWNSRTFLREDARNTEAMRGKFRELLDDLAKLPKHR
jgi:hypothetical protein